MSSITTKNIAAMNSAAKNFSETQTESKGMNAFLSLREAARKNGIQDMSLDEINEEIRLTRIKTENHKNG